MKQRFLVPLLSALATLLLAVPMVYADASIGASASVKVKLTVAPGGGYLVGKPIVPIVSPHRITLGLSHGGVFRTRVFGLGKGHVVYLGARARPFVLVGAPVVVVAPGAAIGGAAVVVGAPAVVIQPPSVVVGVPGVVVVTPGKHGHGHFKGKGKGKFK